MKDREEIVTFVLILYKDSPKTPMCLIFSLAAVEETLMWNPFDTPQTVPLDYVTYNGSLPKFNANSTSSYTRAKRGILLWSQCLYFSRKVVSKFWYLFWITFSPLQLTLVKFPIRDKIPRDRLGSVPFGSRCCLSRLHPEHACWGNQMTIRLWLESDHVTWSVRQLLLIGSKSFVTKQNKPWPRRRLHHLKFH